LDLEIQKEIVEKNSGTENEFNIMHNKNNCSQSITDISNIETKRVLNIPPVNLNVKLNIILQYILKITHNLKKCLLKDFEMKK